MEGGGGGNWVDECSAKSYIIRRDVEEDMFTLESIIKVSRNYGRRTLISVFSAPHLWGCGEHSVLLEDQIQKIQK